jgi:chromosome segregation ATPase
MAAQGVLLLTAMVSGTCNTHLSLVQIKAQSLKGDNVELPNVEAVMAKSSETFAGVMEQANLLQSTLEHKQKQYFDQLAYQKRQYEFKLEVQRKENREIKDSVNKIIDQIKQTKKSSAALRNSSAILLQNVSDLRVEFKKLESKLNTAKSFAALSLNNASDSSSELEVLNTPKPINRQQPQPDALAALGKSETVEQAMEFMVYGHHGRVPGNDDDDSMEASLLQVGSFDSSSMLSRPDLSMISALSSGVEQIETEYRKATEKLKGEFTERKNAGSQERAALLQRKEQTMHVLESLVAIQSKLQTANKSLKKTQGQLMQRIKGLKMYLFQLSNP